MGKTTTLGKTRALLLCALFAALIAAGAFIRIPVPVLPFTLQTLFVLLAGLLLGPRWGALSVIAYVAIGLVGIPIFTQGGGPQYVFQPSFGYLLAFIPGAYLTGWLARRGAPTLPRLLLACAAGLAVIYAIGMTYLYFITNLYVQTPMSVRSLFMSCFVLMLPGDVVKTVFAAVLARRLLPALEKMGVGGRKAPAAE